MTSQERKQAAATLSGTADRLDELADVAELMGDDATAKRFRSDAAKCRDQAMSILD